MRPRSWRMLLSIVVGFRLVACSLPGLQAATQEPVTMQGCKLELRGLGEAHEVRHARLVALRVAAGEAPGALIPKGQWTARWTGTIRVPLRDRYRFSLEGQGKARLTIGGKQVFDGTLGLAQRTSIVTLANTTRLRKGANPFELEFESLASGVGSLRLLWQGYDFARELVPPTVLACAAEDQAMRQGDLALRGRAFVAQRLCLRCHVLATEVQGGMPELRRRGRDLSTVGERLRESWMARWIENPQALRAAARMPRVLHGKRAAIVQEAQDLAAWLMTLRSPAEAPAKVTADARKGGEDFVRLGCFACHARPGAEQAREASSQAASELVSLAYLRAKWQSAARLAQFLRKPEQHDRWIRMPNFALSEDEAAGLAAFLWAKSRALPQREQPFVQGDATRGKALAAKLGCARCHALPEMLPEMQGSSGELAPKPWARVYRSAALRGCAAGQGAGPHFLLQDAERAALQAFVTLDDGASFARKSPAEFALRQIGELRCSACHRFDGAGSRWEQRVDAMADLAAEPEPDRVEQLRPSLTFSGEKLRSEWTQKFLAGEIASPRPWLHARMPRFRSRARELANGLAAMHGLRRTRKSAIAKPRADLAALGARIVGKKGHACTTCHAIAGMPATQVFESPGINFALVAGRLRHDYYLRWTLDPMRFDERTKMTKFADERGRTQLDLCEGKAAQQFEAVWHYLLKGAKMGPPDERDR